MKLLIEKISSQKVLMFRELTKDLTSIEEIDRIWKNREGNEIFRYETIIGRVLVNHLLWDSLLNSFNWDSLLNEFKMTHYNEFKMTQYIEVGNFIKQRLLKDKRIDAVEVVLLDNRISAQIVLRTNGILI